jgi:hypothetical protein
MDIPNDKKIELIIKRFLRKKYSERETKINVMASQLPLSSSNKKGYVRNDKIKTSLKYNFLLIDFRFTVIKYTKYKINIPIKIKKDPNLGNKVNRYIIILPNG